MRYEGTVYRPPSEAASLIVQLTVGCSHNQCTFCTMYKDKVFRIRPLDEIRQDLQEAGRRWGGQIRRIFFADGDALVLKTEDLLKIISYAFQCCPGAERISSYGTPGDILRKTDEELRCLAQAGLKLVYMGAESGDDQVLSEICKGVSSDDIIRAGCKLKRCGIASSVTLISGLGGRRRLKEHAAASANLISRINPEYVGFLTLMLDPKAPVMEKIRSGEMELLKRHEILEEMRIFLANVDSEGTVFRSNHASNYITLKGTLNKDIPRMCAELDEVEQNGSYRPESFRAL